MSVIDVKPGELLGVVGESGSAKSVTMMSLTGPLPSPPAEVDGAHVNFDGHDLLRISDEQMRAIRGASIGFIFQDPMTSLNPVFTVGFQLMEPLRNHMGLSKSAARKQAVELLELVGIPDAERRLKNYPHRKQNLGELEQSPSRPYAAAPYYLTYVTDEGEASFNFTLSKKNLNALKNSVSKLSNRTSDYTFYELYSLKNHMNQFS